MMYLKTRYQTSCLPLNVTKLSNVKMRVSSVYSTWLLLLMLHEGHWSLASNSLPSNTLSSNNYSLLFTRQIELVTNTGKKANTGTLLVKINLMFRIHSNPALNMFPNLR